MKRALVLLMVLMLLSTACAEGITIRELPQYNYIRLSLLNPEAYPEVRLMESYAFAAFSGYREPVFLCFPGPEGIENISYFEANAVRYTDAENLIQYSYYEHDSASFEEFLNNAEDESAILLDGSDGTAAYYNLDYGHAYGLIPTQEFGKSAKLEIDISLAYLDDKMPEKTRRQALSDAILNELDRVKGTMRYETFDGFWSKGMYKGVKLLDYDFKYLLCAEFPGLTRQVDGRKITAPFTITKVDGPHVEGTYDFGDGKYIEMEMQFSEFDGAIKKLNEGAENVRGITLSNGSQWILELCNIDDDGSIYAWRGTRLTDCTNHRDEPLYIEFYFSRSGRAMGNWANEAACVADLTALEGCLSIVDPEDDPYVPGEAAAPETATTPEDEGLYTGEGGTLADMLNLFFGSGDTGSVMAPAPAAPEVSVPDDEDLYTGDGGTLEDMLNLFFGTGDTGSMMAPAPSAPEVSEPEDEDLYGGLYEGNGGTLEDMLSLFFGLGDTDSTMTPGTTAPEAPAPATVAPESAGEWTCPGCGSVNTGKFCAECGTPKPVSGKWTCAVCGSVNEGKFCPECGSPRP